MCAKRDAKAARLGSFERFKTKTHFNSLKRLVGVTALGALAVKLLAVALATAAGDGTPLDLLVRVPAGLADLGAALLVFEVLRTRRPLQLACRSAILVAVSPVLFVASGIHGDLLGVAVALLLLAMYLLVDRDAPLVAGITLAVASRVEPMVLLAAPVAMAVATARTAPGVAGDPAAARARLVHFAGALAGALFAAWVPRDLVWPAVFGYLGDARWASIYAVAAGATLLWTATWWGTGIPWDAGVDPATVPAGSVAGLGLVTWVVLGSWLFLGWRTVAVQSRAGAVGSGAVAVESGAVDDRAHPPPEVGYAPPPGDPATVGRGEARPADDGEPRPADGAVPANSAVPADDTSPSRPSVGVPK